MFLGQSSGKYPRAENSGVFKSHKICRLRLQRKIGREEWRPSITPLLEHGIMTNDRTGAATVSFYASDSEGQYRVIVEGVTGDGKPVRGEYLITVNR